MQKGRRLGGRYLTYLPVLAARSHSRPRGGAAGSRSGTWWFAT